MTSARVSSGENGKVSVRRLGSAMRQLSATLLSALLIFQPMLANAQSVSAAGSAPAANQPGVGAAPNGVPLIDIVTPNGAGLSHNKYDNFNVGAPGLILNNFNGQVGTSNLGGVTPGNPNLKNSGSATVILNEVTSGNRSALNGPTEVFGGRADVIVANPNGITCSGCGFINTPHATLTTGVPNIGADGSLTGFTVNGGDVTFEGAGGNFASGPGAVDLFDVVARNIHVNAPVYGKTIRLTGGASKYDYATGEATALTAMSGTPEYAIDGSALGAMQADRIKVVVTEKGAGVKMSGDMAANAGELSLSADGKISIGNASGSQGVTITSKRQVTAAKVSSKQKVAVQADQGITLQSVAADSDIVLASGTGLLSVSGDINSGTTVQMSSGGGIAAGSVTAGNGAATLSATSGNIAIAGAANSTGDLNLTATAGSISAGSLLSNQNIALSAGLDIAVAGNVLAQGNVSATGRSIATDMTISGINVAATSADPNGNVVLGFAGNLSLTAIGGNITTGNLLSAGSLNTSATGSMSSGSIQSNSDLTVNTASLTAQNVTSHGTLTINASTDVTGQILGAGNILISGSAIEAGAIVSGVDFAATQAANGSLVIGSTGDITLQASSSLSANTLLAAEAISVTAADVSVGNVTGHQAITLSGSSSLTANGQVLGAGDVSLSGGTVSANQVISGLDFAATEANGGSITLGTAGDLTLRASGNLSATALLAAGTITATAADLSLGSVTGHSDIALSGSNSLTVTSQILGANDISLSGGAVSTSQVVTGVDFAAMAQSSTGAILIGSAGELTVNATSATSGPLLVAGDLNVTSGSFTASNVTGHGDVTVNAATNLTGTLLAAGTVDITGSSITAGTLVSGVDFIATSQSTGGSVVLGSTGALTLKATAGNINASNLLAAGGISATASGSIGNTTPVNAVAHQNLTMTAGGTIALAGQSMAAGNVNLQSQSITAGSLVSGVDFAATRASTNGALMLAQGNAQSGTMTLTASNGDITASNALLSGGNLSAAASGDISYALLQSLANASLTAPGSISYTNNSNVTGNLTIDTGTIDLSGTRGAKLAIGGTLAVTATSANLTGSSLILGGLALNLSGQANLRGAQVNTVTNAGGSGDIAITAAGLTASDTTTLLAAHDLTLTLPTFSNAGQLAAGNNLTINTSGDLTNTSSGLLYAGNDASLLVAGTLTNNQGAILAGNDLTIAGSALAQRNQATTNISGLIQAGGDISILTSNLTNRTTATPSVNRNVLISSDVLHPYDIIGQSGTATDSPVQQTVTEDQLTASAGPAAKIIGGGNITIDATDLINSYSAIEAGGNMALTVAGTLTNEGTTLNRVVSQVCDDGTPCQYYPDVTITTTVRDCSGPNRPCIDRTTTTYQPNPNGTRDASKDLNPGTTVVSITPVGQVSGGIKAAGDLTVTAGTLNNTAASGSLNGRTAVNAPASQNDPLTALNGMTAGGALFTVNAALSNVAGNGTITANGGLTAALGSLTQISPANVAQLTALAKPQSGGVGGTIPGQGFIFETRAAFLDVSKFYGSSYFLGQTGYNPETNIPFLGDAYFDNQLVDTQLRQLVGDGLGKGSFIPGNSAIDQMKSLLDNGAAYAEANGLAFGQGLTSEQAANLKQSMVIYQAQTINGVQVLAPVVYLSAADRAKANVSGATIAGGAVDMTVGNLANSGTVAAAGGLTIAGSSIKSTGTFYAGGNLNLTANNGITLASQTMSIGGQTLVNANGGATAGGNIQLAANGSDLTLQGAGVKAGGSAQLSGNNVTLAAAKQDNGGKQSLVGTNVSAGGNLAINGNAGVTVIASSASSGGNMAVTSNNGAVSIVSAGVQNTTVDINRGTRTKTISLTQEGSSLTSGGSMLISGDQGVLIAGSSLDAKSNLGIASTNGDITITSSQDQTTGQSKTTPGRANGYRGGQTSSASLTNNGSLITSENGGITVEADQGNVNVIGSRIDAAGSSANLIAKGDVTIGEATDTASSSSSRGKKKSSETTTTAQGSSIAGQTGVNIVSSGGNVTISASDLTAGDATHKADANIQANGNIVIASGKDTKETTTDSKSSGFLSSKKTHTHSYDEDTVGSSVSASGNINASAGGETVVSGSNMAAGDNLALSGSTVTVMGAEESHESDKQVKKSGIGVGSGGGFISIYGSKDQKSSQSSTDNIGSTLSSGGSTSITSTQGDVNIFGSSSHSGTGTAISSARDVNIAPGAEEQSSSSQTKRSGFGINFASNSGSLSIGIGVGKSEEKRSKNANINAVSTLESDGSITIAANRDINDQSGQILASGPIGLIARDDVNMLSSNDVTNASEMQRKSFAGVSLTVQSSLISAGQQAAQAGSLLSGDNSAYGIAPALLAGINGYKALQSTYAAATATPDPNTGLRPPVAGVSLTAGYSFSESSSQSTTSIPVPPVIRGSSVTIVAQSGDVIGRGVQISAGFGKDGKDGKAPVASSDPDNGSVLISAAGNVDLESVQATSDSKSSAKAGSVGIGVAAGVDIGGNLIGAGPTASASFNSGKSNGTSVTQLNSNVSGTSTVTVVAGDTLTLAGGVLSGKTVNATAANGIIIESRQDTASYDERSRSAALGFGPSSGGLAGGYNQGTVTGNYANVSQQSGIFAGSGGYHVSTDGTIDLKGGFIGSTAAPANNTLNANQILYSDIGNSMSASSTSYGFGLQGGIPVPIVGQPAKQNDSGATLATITPGNWNLTGQSQDLSGLNTDASKANNTVDSFDIDKLKAQQQSAAALSILLNTGVGELSQQLGFAEGSPEKVALHAAVGAIVSQLAGNNVGAGALGGAASEIANGVLQQVLQADPNLTDTQKSAITQWVAVAVGAAAGGGTGAAAALDNVNYNYLTHKEREEFARALADCKPGDSESPACGRVKELQNLSISRDQRLDTCVGNSSALCVKARTDLRIAAAEYLDAALTGNGEGDEMSLLDRHLVFLQAWQYADSSDTQNGQDFGDEASKLKSDAAKALLTGSKDEIQRIIRDPIIGGAIAWGGTGNAKAIIGEGAGSGRGSGGTTSGESAGNPTTVPSDWRRVSGIGSQTSTPKGFASYLTPDGDIVHVSPAGLVYGYDPKFVNRIDHVLAHTQVDPTKNVHSVFSAQGDGALALVDQAWKQRGLPLANDPQSFVVPMGQQVVGTAGETSIKIVVKSPGSNEIITAYPVP